MDPKALALLYSIVSLIGFGLGNGMSKKYASSVGPIRLTVYRNFVVVPINLIAFLIFLNKASFDVKYILIGIGISCVSYFGLFFFNKGLEVGKVGVVAPLSSGRIILTSILGVLFLSDSINYLKGVSILVILLGIILTSIDFKELKNSRIFDIKSGIPFALLAALFWGVTFAFFKVPSKVIGAYLFSLILETCVLSVSTIQLLLSKQKFFLSNEEFKKN